MRLINTSSMKLRAFYGEPGRDVPPYAILSHTWGNDEISYQEFTKGVSDDRAKVTGYVKVKKCCEVARQLGIQWAWADTCCIDSSSSAELSEAINSMFNWYAKSKVCLAYLSDVQSVLTPKGRVRDLVSVPPEELSLESRWFTRGWTLQELLAPLSVTFYDSNWHLIGDKVTLKRAIAKASRISEEALLDTQGDWERYSVAERLSWAARRETTRSEDEAYCLLGLFGVNMPLLYGEGSKAFLRLQEEIINRSSDQSIYAWSLPETYHNRRSGLLAPSAKHFQYQVSVAAAAESQACDSEAASFTAMREHVQGCFEGYARPFQAAGNIIAIHQPVLGPLHGIYVQSMTTSEQPDIPCITALHTKGSGCFANNSTATAIETGSGGPRGDAVGWQVFHDQVVYLVPLLCSIGGRTVCLLISQPDGDQPLSLSDQASLRLHSPSLVSLNPLFMCFIRSKGDLHAYAHQPMDARLLHATDSTSSSTAYLVQPALRHGYPRISISNLLLNGYYAFSYYIMDDGLLSRHYEFDPNNPAPSKQIVTFIHERFLRKKDDGLLLWGQVTRPSDAPPPSITGHRSRSAFSVSIALYDDSIAVAFFRRGTEPLLNGRFGAAPAPPPSAQRDNNPFVGMPGLIATNAFDIWTLGQEQMYRTPITWMKLESHTTATERTLVLSNCGEDV